MKKLIVAHRGAAPLKKENTLESFEKAMECGADMIELDVRRSKDKVLVVSHDAKINRRKIKNLTFSEIHSLNPQVPTLEQTLKLTAGKILLDVELKEAGYERQVAELLLKHLTPDKFVVTSFFIFSLYILKHKFPKVKTGLLINKINHKWLEGAGNILYYAAVLGSRADFMAPHYSRAGIIEGNFKKPLYVWTVDDFDKASNLFQNSNVKAIITNKAFELKTFTNELIN